VLDVDDICSVIGAIDFKSNEAGYLGIDPYDALSSPRLPALLQYHGRLRQIALQAAKRSPIDLRPALGVAPRRIVKALGLFASGYAALHAAGWEGPAHERAQTLLAWLQAARVPSGRGWAWGYEFDVQTRWAFYPAGTPNMIATAFTGNAFLDWYEQSSKEELLATARGAAQYLEDELIVDVPRGEYFAYVPRATTLIHNANALGAAFVARVGHFTGEKELVGLGHRAGQRILQAQDESGLWPYGEGKNLGWIDGFHTAYVLDALYTLWQVSGDRALAESLRRGVNGYIERLFTAEGVPRYSTSSLYPIDIHCASSAIDLFTRLGHLDQKYLVMAQRVLAWTIANMWDPEGFFHYQKTRWYTNKVNYIRWSQAHIFKAMTRMLRTMTT